MSPSDVHRSLAEIAEQLGASAQQLKQLALQVASLRSRLQRSEPAASQNVQPPAELEQV